MPSTIQYNNFDRPLPELQQDEAQILLTAMGTRTNAPDEAIMEQTEEFLVNYGQNFIGRPITDTDWIQQAQRIPKLLGGALIEAAPGWIHVFLRNVIAMRVALECICDRLGSSMVVTSTILGKPENLQVTFGQPSPDVFAAGWVVFYDAEGYYGQRQFIFTDKQIFRADIPNPVGYDTYTMPGFNIVFNP